MPLRRLYGSIAVVNKSPSGPASAHPICNSKLYLTAGRSLFENLTHLALFRPHLLPVKDTMPVTRPPANKKPVPPDQTNAENFYYMKQMQAKTPMVISLTDGEVIQGVIEWYDKTCLKVNREGVPNLLLFKANIKYMYKVGD